MSNPRESRQPQNLARQLLAISNTADEGGQAAVIYQQILEEMRRRAAMGHVAADGLEAMGDCTSAVWSMVIAKLEQGGLKVRYFSHPSQLTVSWGHANEDENNE